MVAEIPSKAASLLSPTPPAENPDHIRKVQTTLQTQIDALNRAVRRYEKRATAQTMQTEARLQDLETRLRDALSLAAVAANYSQKPGVLSIGFNVLGRLLFLPIKAVRNAGMYPLLLINKVTTDVMVRTGLAVDEKREKIGAGGKGSYGKTMRDSLFPRKLNK